MRLLAIALMCGAMICFTGLDTSSKWLGARIPTLEIVWARYLIAAADLAAGGASLVAAERAALDGGRDCRPCGRSCCSVRPSRSVLGLHWLQLAESATISFLNPIFVALLAAPLLGERVGRRADRRDRRRLRRRPDRDPSRARALSSRSSDRHWRRRSQFRLCHRDAEACRRRFGADDAGLDAGRPASSRDAGSTVGSGAGRTRRKSGWSWQGSECSARSGTAC